MFFLCCKSNEEKNTKKKPPSVFFFFFVFFSFQFKISQKMSDGTCATEGTQDAWMPRVVVFDFDGTLVDSLGVWDELGLDWIARHHLAPWPTMQEEMAVATLSDAAQLAHTHYNLGSVCDF